MIAGAGNCLPYRMRLIDRPGEIHLRKRSCRLSISARSIPPDFHEVVNLKDGSQVTLRPIRPDDAPRLQEGFSRLTPQTIYMRFLQAAKELTDQQARELAEVDYQTRMAIVGYINEGGHERLVVVARYGMLLDRAEEGLAEAAIVVRDDYQMRGLGKIAMQYLVRYASEHGVHGLVATVHASNTPILTFIRNTGLPFKKKILEPGIWEIIIPIPSEGK
jgi:acetyltransferase